VQHADLGFDELIGRSATVTREWPRLRPAFVTKWRRRYQSEPGQVYVNDGRPLDARAIAAAFMA